jgi:putative nucleotidyltransferase with HDIG domain
MFSSFETFSARRRGIPRGRPGGAAAPTGARDETTPTRLLGYLPLVVLTTASVIVVPAVLVASFVPKGGPLLMLASTASAMAVSVAIASAEAALWTRWPGSRDVIFVDLMLWGWLRRYWTERRLTRTRALYEASRKAGLTVGIELLEDLSKRLEARDVYTHGHNQRVARHAERIARAIHLSPSEVAKIRTAAMVHDVGKIYTPREILNNPGRLTEREYAIVKLHASDGADMLAEVGDPEIASLVRHHHERVDGHGYPDGLLGADIPLGARIIAVADTFDAITSNRPYRPVGTHKRALDVLSQQAGSQLDSAAVAAFLSRYSARRSVAWFAFATTIPQRIFAVLQAASPSIGASTGAVTSILPALGAAGLLTLSPGLRGGTAFVRGAYGQPTVAQAHQPVLSKAPTTDAALPKSRQTVTTRLTRPARHRPPKTARTPARTPLNTPVSKSPRLRTPISAGTGTDEPVTTTSKTPSMTGSSAPTVPVSAPNSPAPAPTSPSPTPTSPPAPIPTQPTPPAKEASKSPALPSVPPVSIPQISTPPISIPPINIPPVTLPKIPSISLPGLSISTQHG